MVTIPVSECQGLHWLYGTELSSMLQELFQKFLQSEWSIKKDVIIFLGKLLLSNQYIEYFTVFVHLSWPKIHQKENLIYLNKILEKKKLCSLSTLYIKSFSLYLLHLLCSSLSGVSNFPHCEFVLYKIRCSFINYTMHDELL